MRVPSPKYPVVALLLSLGLCVIALSADDSPVGVWRGESLCTAGHPSCHDEKVVYYIEAIPDKPASMLIRADKIVDGKAITMGSGPWQYDGPKHTLSWESEQRLWLLTIKGKRIEGTLTEPGNVVFRRVTLSRSTPVSEPRQ
jgi:hypothetical protein